ncbi:MAG TPA: hypothetical protein VF993_07340 [Myxococcales bacterium]
MANTIAETRPSFSRLTQAKSALISLDSEKAKAPEPVLIEAPLPTLKPEMAAAPQQAPAQEIAR